MRVTAGGGGDGGVGGGGGAAADATVSGVRGVAAATAAAPEDFFPDVLAELPTVPAAMEATEPPFVFPAAPLPP